MDKNIRAVITMLKEIPFVDITHEDNVITVDQWVWKDGHRRIRVNLCEIEYDDEIMVGKKSRRQEVTKVNFFYFNVVEWATLTINLMDPNSLFTIERFVYYARRVYIPMHTFFVVLNGPELLHV